MEEKEHRRNEQRKGKKFVEKGSNWRKEETVEGKEQLKGKNREKGRRCHGEKRYF